MGFIGVSHLRQEDLPFKAPSRRFACKREGGGRGGGRGGGGGKG